VPVPALRVEMVAQAWHYSRAVPLTGTILAGPGHAWVVLFRVVPGLPHRVSAKWPSMSGSSPPLSPSSSTKPLVPALGSLIFNPLTALPSDAPPSLKPAPPPPTSPPHRRHPAPCSHGRTPSMASSSWGSQDVASWMGSSTARPQPFPKLGSVWKIAIGRRTPTSPFPSPTPPWSSRRLLLLNLGLWDAAPYLSSTLWCGVPPPATSSGTSSRAPSAPFPCSDVELFFSHRVCLAQPSDPPCSSCRTSPAPAPTIASHGCAVVLLKLRHGVMVLDCAPLSRRTGCRPCWSSPCRTSKLCHRHSATRLHLAKSHTTVLLPRRRPFLFSPRHMPPRHDACRRL
jgi:hypothetical protein